MPKRPSLPLRWSASSLLPRVRLTSSIRLPGLALRVSYGGRKAWAFFYRFGGKPRRMSLGTYPALSLSDAHKAWRAARESAQAGRDPSLVTKPATGAKDFSAVLDEWFKRDQANNRSAPSTRRLLAYDATPIWGHRLVTEIGRPDVMELIDSIVDRGSPVTARRVHAHLHRFRLVCIARVHRHQPDDVSLQAWGG